MISHVPGKPTLRTPLNSITRASTMPVPGAKKLHRTQLKKTKAKRHSRCLKLTFIVCIISGERARRIDLILPSSSCCAGYVSHRVSRSSSVKSWGSELRGEIFLLFVLFGHSRIGHSDHQCLDFVVGSKVLFKTPVHMVGRSMLVMRRRHKSCFLSSCGCAIVWSWGEMGTRGG